MQDANYNLVMLEKVANGLGALKDQVVFVGGATVSLYATAELARESRMTNDVDCTIQLTSRGDYYKLEAQLRDLGFENDIREGAPICRWIFQEIAVDVMPSGSEVLGFSNPWYPEGIKRSIPFTLPESTQVRIFPVPYFLAAKVEAFQNRGADDIRFSKDFEDIVYLFDSRPDLLEELAAAEPKIKAYLAEKFQELLKDRSIEEGVYIALNDRNPGSRVAKIMRQMRQISDMKL